MRRVRIFWLRQRRGSGKTAVLVERIINKVINDNIDIDRILVVTFTNAAASEMRERILDAIYKKLEDEPESANLQRQITLLNKASICTIHSFCLDVIRNNFYEIDTSANFRIGDTAEVELLKNEAIDEIFEQKYMDQDEGFIKLIETYTDYRGDEKLQNIILGIYKYIQSAPFPEKWLKEKVAQFDLSEDIDFATTAWGKIILDHTRDEVNSMVTVLESTKRDTARFPELEKFTLTLQDDINRLNSINFESWDLAYNAMSSFAWSKWPVDKKATLELKEIAKGVRDNVKKQFAKVVLKASSQETVSELKEMHGVLVEIEKLVLEFCEVYAAKKKEKNIIDFNDIEHFALKILLDEDGNPSAIAKKYREKFEEIAIDEYQDSNMVQEKLLTSISRGNNIFMVGDVKQSIYKFRQAMPELFLEKYNTYKLKKEYEKEVDGLKIQLFKNFRSRRSVLDITNLVFENIMSEKLGDVQYNEEEYLNYGADYPKLEEEMPHAGTAELHIIDLKEETEDEDEQVEGEEEQEIEERVEDAVIEARFVAKKIKELFDKNYMVFDKAEKQYRKIRPKDICVLLRATTVLAPIYEKEISDIDKPVFSDSSSTYLESMEVETIMSLLKIIDNPMQDIPLVTVLRSSICGFTDNELIKIRINDPKSTFYEAMLKSRMTIKGELKDKIECTISSLEKWKTEQKYYPLNEFIWKLYLETGFFDYVSLLPNGNLRQANLKLLFEKAKQYEKVSFKGLFNFINFIEKVKTSSGDSSSAKIIGENDDVIRIMSIHKSKGLEFPVVILASTGKKFNMQDLNTPLLMEQELGFGPQYIDSVKKIEFSTAAKDAIRLHSKKQTISEEMRVLYVALTRAREKLIITGMSRNLEKSLRQKRETLEMYKRSDEKQISLEEVESMENGSGLNGKSGREDGDRIGRKIAPKVVEKYTSYLDWLELVYEYNKPYGIENTVELYTYKKEKVLKELKKQEHETVDMAKLIEKKANVAKQGEGAIMQGQKGETSMSAHQLKETREREQNAAEEKELSATSEDAVRKDFEKLNWEYRYLASAKIPTKTSVTKLKQQEGENEQDLEDILGSRKVTKSGRTIEDNKVEIDWTGEAKKLTYIPKFMETEQKLTPAQKGTLIHLCVQKLDEKKDYTMQELVEFVKDLRDRNIISETEAKSIDVKILYNYTRSALWQELKDAREIHKEQPFYINIPAREIYEEAEDSEKILVQGIIDLYYVNKEGKLILIDYKTDRHGTIAELEQKYKSQLELYRRALEDATGKKVDRASICSLR